MDMSLSPYQMTGDIQKDMKGLQDQNFQLIEKLNYLMYNLDVTNFNDLGLARYENGRLQIYTRMIDAAVEGIDIKLGDLETGLEGQITASAKGLRTEFQAADNELDEFLSGEITATATGLRSEYQAADRGLSGRINTVSSSVSQNANSISAIVQAVGSGGTVTAASIVAAINSAGSYVEISADHIDLSGTVTITDLETAGQVRIDGGNISGGTIEGVVLKSAGNRGYQDVQISNGMIDFYSGYLQDNDYGYLELHGTNLTLSGNSGVTLDCDTVTVQVGTYSYFEFSTSGLKYHDSNGSKWAVFQ